jgi:hypothetical protein
MDLFDCQGKRLFATAGIPAARRPHTTPRLSATALAESR